MANQLRLDVAQLTDVGRKREHNEDNMAYVIPKDERVMAIKGALFIVADGMGGHAAGEVASEIAVDTVTNVYYMDDNEDVPGPFLQAIKRANAAIHQRAAENLLRSGMGTTCIAAVLRGNMAYIANVGDSRAYLVRQGLVKQISQDHSWVAEQVRAGFLTEDQARIHAQRNVITRCLGTQPDVEVDVFREPLMEGDLLVLCTDGLSGLISDEELMRIVQQSAPQESVYHLVERANENGGPDNITAIVVRVLEVGVEPPGALNPVLVGGREVSEEETRALQKLSGLTHSISVNNIDGRIISSPLSLGSAPAASHESITLPQPALRGARRNRLFVPTLLLIVIVLLALSGGGVVYFLHFKQSQDIAQSLTSAGQLITKAQGEVATNPSLALTDLATARNTLQGLPNSQQLSTLQSQLVTQVNAAIGVYDTTAKITTLPCSNNGSTSSTINLPGTSQQNAQPQSIAAVQDGQSTLLFSLGSDGSLSMLSASGGGAYTLSVALPASATSKIVAIASGGSQLFLLSEALKGNNVPAGYSLNMYTPGQGNNLGQPLSIPIDQQSIIAGYIPKFITAWSTHAYVVLIGQNQARIFFYAPDAKHTLLVASKAYQFSNSQPISSVATFADQFFIALTDGTVQSFPLAQAFAGQTTQSTIPSGVFIQSLIQTPLPVSQSGYTYPTPVPTVSSSGEPDGPSSLVLHNASIGPIFLAAGQVKGVSHLFIGDPVNSRLLDLTVYSSAGAAGATNGITLTMKLEQQYTSQQYLSVLKSSAVDPQGSLTYLLVQPKTPPLYLVSISTGSQSACGG